MPTSRILAGALSTALVVPALLLTGSPAAHAAAVRPTESLYDGPEATPVCRAHLCVHYAQDGTNDVPTEDDGAGGTFKGTAGNGVPDLVDLVSAALLPKVAKVFTDAGYRAPLGDGTTGGGTDQLDVYLAELADVEGGASCTPESTDTPTTSGFCVLDNDYSAAEYGTRLSPAANVSLDVAHQYASFVQWAYPAWRRWEGTLGAWVEDEIYPSLNRNRALLPYGPLGRPGASMLDSYGNTDLEEQGRWIFLRYLAERFPTEVGTLPVVVRDLLEDGDDAFTSRGTTLLKAFTTFTTWNRNPAAFYDEGATYPTAPLAGNVMLNATTASTKTFRRTGQEWTSFSDRFRPSPSLTGSWRIRIDVSSQSVLHGAGKALVATYKPKGGPAVTRVVAVKDPGDIRASLSFAFTTSVEWVEVRVVTGAVGVGSNPSETGAPAIEVTGRVYRG